MYSYEIDTVIKKNNYNLESQTYLHICKTSPQIKEVKYNGFDDSYEMCTDDDYYWKFKVYYNEKI